MASRLMSDAELRRRKKVQGHLSQVTGGLGLAALGGTLAASRTGRNTLRKIPQLQSKIAKPKPLDKDRDRIQGATVPILATSAGLGGAGSFNFAAYTGAESRKRNMTQQPAKKPLKKNYQPPQEMGFYGEEGRPIKLPEIKVPIEKAWSPTASNFDSERSRQKRNKVYEGGALVGAGAGGAYGAHHGMKAAHAARGDKTVRAAPLIDVDEKYTRTGKKSGQTKTHYRKVTRAGKETRMTPPGAWKPTIKHGGKAAAGVAAVGAAALGHKAIKRKQEKSWEPYAKNLSAFGVDHLRY